MGKFIDLIGSKYNRLSVMAMKRDNENKIFWICSCECGNEKEVVTSTASLRNGNTKSCGCLQKEKVLNLNKNKKIDMANRKFGKLTVINSIEQTTPHGNHIWRCECECGNFTEVPQGGLHSGGIQSCGCGILEAVSKTGKKYGGMNYKDIVGQTFGWMKVLERNTNIKKIPTFLCKCLLCGGEGEVKGKLLKNGHVKSCGCLKSTSEMEVKELLIDKNITFKQQFRIKECKRKHSLPFDFAIFHNNKLAFLIELDGIQHYIEQYSFKDLDYIQANDLIKTNYCSENGIPLLRIPYTEFGNKESRVLEWLANYKLI